MCLHSTYTNVLSRFVVMYIIHIFLLSTTAQVCLFKDEIYLSTEPIENILIIGFRYIRSNAPPEQT